MRRSFVILIVFALAAAAVLLPMIGRSEQNHPETKLARISDMVGNDEHALPNKSQASPSNPLWPTKLRFTNLSVADGLSNPDVRAIAQDRQGFIWLGTWLGGLNRYDGYTFKVYKHDDQDDSSLGCDSIWALYVDRAGNLWVGTNEGIDRYDQDTDSFVHYRDRADDLTGLSRYQARSLVEDESGTLWAATSDGLSRFDRASSRFFTLRHNQNDPNSFGSTNLRSICLDATTGLLWVGIWHEGVTVLDRSTGHFINYKNNPNDPASLSNNDVDHIFQDREGNMWFSTARGLNRFDPKNHGFIRYLHDSRNPASLSNDYVSTTYEDRAGRFWVATNNGLNLMDRAHGKFSRYMHYSSDFSSLSSDAINVGGVYEDAVGALWIGTRSTGVDRWAGVPERFTTYRHNSQDVNSPSNDVITAVAVGNTGELWIGTEAGVDRFDGKGFTHYLTDANDPNRLSPGPQRAVAQDSRGAVWTGTYGGGLDRLDGRGVKHFRHDPKNSDSPANDQIASLVPDSVGGLWIGVHGNGMDYFDGRHFTHFLPNHTDSAGLPEATVMPLLLEGRGMLWIATASSGVVRFDTHTRKFTTYLMDPKQPGNQAVNWTEDVYSDGASIWVASPTNGLYRLDPETGKFTHHYTEKDGLANNSVGGVVGDTLGNLWISTANGLSKFDPQSQTFRNYDMFDGLQGNGFSPHCHAKVRDGRLFFAGGNGLSAFYADKLPNNPTPPLVVLTAFELFNKPVKVGGKDSPLQKAIHVASSIALRHDQSVFGFQFAALDFTAPQKNRYAYQLDDFDRDWQYTDAIRRFATYTNLDPGDYTFRVKASNNDGVWNEQGLALHLTIVPPWWRTTWFRSACIAAFLAMVWGVYELRVRQLAAQFNMRLEERVAERTRIARDLHDTLLQGFQGLLLRLQTVLIQIPKRPEKACEILESALVSAEQAITEGRDAVQKLRSGMEGSLEQMLLDFSRSLASSQAGADWAPSLRVIVQGNRRKERSMIGDEVERIARELVRNAYLHARAQSIEAELRYEDDAFLLIVRDDGKGIDPAVLKDRGRAGHWGLPGMYERAEGIGARLDIWSEVGAGTEARLTVPASIAYEKNGNRGRFKLFRKTRIYEHRS